MRHLLQSIIISIAAIAIASPTFADNDREDKTWDKDKKEQNHRGKKVPSRAGGLPKCESELAECTINLTETETQLAVCEDALAQCQATAGQAFPATGQTTCYDTGGGVIPCDGSGQDGDIRAGATLAYTDNGDGTIADDNTDLMWMKQDDNNLGCDSYPGNLDIDCEFIWDEAFAFVTNLNANNHAGYTNWRVPNVKELLSIVNFQKVRPAVSEAFHDTGCTAGCTVETCSCTSANVYWSSTSFAEFPFEAWRVDYTEDGGTVVFLNKEVTVSVRAVRGGL